MLRLAIIIAIITLGGVVAYAQSIGGNQGIGVRIGGQSSGGGGGGACSNAFDFSQACNSMYLGGL